MHSLFTVHQGRILPDFSIPILVVAAIEYEKVSRSERFILHKGQIDRAAALYRWTDDWEMNLQKVWGAERLMGLEVARATTLIETDLQKEYAHDLQIARTYCPYAFDLISEPKPYLVTKQLMGELPSLKLLGGSRCDGLRNLIDELARLKPLVSEIDDKHWYGDGT